MEDLIPIQSSVVQWSRKKQDRDGTYRFDGQMLVTAGVQTELLPFEVEDITRDLMNLVEQQDGIDYLVVYQRQDGTKVWCMDQLNDEMKPHHPPEHHYWTMLLPSEY